MMKTYFCVNLRAVLVVKNSFVHVAERLLKNKSIGWSFSTASLYVNYEI